MTHDSHKVSATVIPPLDDYRPDHCFVCNLSHYRSYEVSNNGRMKVREFQASRSLLLPQAHNTKHENMLTMEKLEDRQIE
jgi:hypothetical protein